MPFKAKIQRKKQTPAGSARRRAASLAAAALALAFLATGCQKGDPDQLNLPCMASIEAVAGEAAFFSLAVGDWVAAEQAPDRCLRPGDRVRTKSKSGAFLVMGDGHLLVGPAGELELSAADEAEKDRPGRIKISQGEIWFLGTETGLNVEWAAERGSISGENAELYAVFQPSKKRKRPGNIMIYALAGLLDAVNHQTAEGSGPETVEIEAPAYAALEDEGGARLDEWTWERVAMRIDALLDLFGDQLSELRFRTAARLRKRCPVDMVEIPAGYFTLGDNAGPTPEKPQRPVATDAYCIDRFEFPNEPGEQPIETISWEAAQTACAAAGKRLCSEVEWEKACRGPQLTRWTYGDEFVPGACNIHSGANFGPGAVGAAGGIQPSGSFPDCTNEYGVYDMSGNLWEWTSDPYVPYSRGEEGRLMGGTYQVFRGGSFVMGPEKTRCSQRSHLDAPEYGWTNIGWRCCM